MKGIMFVLLLLLAVGLGFAVLSLPDQATGLRGVVAEQIASSGVSHPVTAVLLNFRGYDTLLEMAVLLLALLGVWSLWGVPRECPKHSPGQVLDTLTRLLAPVLLLVTAYLLWSGAHAPGGAFQAGSVLGAAGVVLLLSGWRLPARATGLPLRIALVAGLFAFLTVALLPLSAGRRLLEYNPLHASSLIFIIELFATLSIGVTLATLFFGTDTAGGKQR